MLIDTHWRIAERRAPNMHCLVANVQPMCSHEARWGILMEPAPSDVGRNGCDL